MKRYTALHALATLLILTSACAPKTKTATSPQADLSISILYPAQTTEVEMGQSLKSIIKVLDKDGRIVEHAQVALSFEDPDGALVASLPAKFGNGAVYRSDAWIIPHQMQEGSWTLTVEAKTETQRGATKVDFHVRYSISEILLHKYGFWVDSPALRGINPTLTSERGDAHNGAITWGGVIPSMHVFPESWLEVQWRAGNFHLENGADVIKFFLSTLGNPGVYPTRSFESFEKTRFKNWDAWQVRTRGQLSRYDEQWMIFYAPEVDKTYALGTTVVLAPKGMDAHDVLRQGFEVHPELDANGIAPQPLSRLLPPIELISPEPGRRFFGTDQPIVLKWKPAEELAQDQYYLVSLDYNYQESNPGAEYVTREAQFVLPESFYHLPNCGIFNWRVTLMQQTGVDQNGQPEGKPLGFNSLYWYVQWQTPPGQEAAFKPLCPNEQY